MPYLETEKSDRKNGDETNHGFTWSSCCSPLTLITYDSRISTRIVSTDWFETLNLEVSCCQPEICSRHILQFHYLMPTLEIGLPRPFISIYLCILAWLIKQPNLDFEKSTKENRICQCGNNVGGTWPKDRWIACKVLWAAIIVMRQPPAGYCLAE